MSLISSQGPSALTQGEVAGESKELCRVTSPAWSPFLCWYPTHHMAMLQNHKKKKKRIACSRQDTEGLQVGIGGAEMDALRNVVEMLPCG